ncbi:MAG: hypothetical protein AAGH99_10115 [Planctomycetota bacterium]
MNQEGLTHEAKEAIRRYMLHLIVIPSSVAVVLSFTAGFFFNKVIATEAKMSVLEQSTLARVELMEVNQDLESAKRFIASINEIRNRLDDEDVVEVADFLSSAPNLSDFGNRLAAIEQSLSEAGELAVSKLTCRDIVLSDDQGNTLIKLSNKKSKAGGRVRTESGQILIFTPEGGELVNIYGSSNNQGNILLTDHSTALNRTDYLGWK